MLLKPVQRLYSASILNKTAELMPKDGVSVDAILEELLKQKVQIIKFQLDYPSLNQVFIDIMKDEK